MRRHGFTYTELLCVMTIALVVWMLLLPVAVRSRNRADETICGQHLRNLSWALTMYAQDHYGHFPPALTALTPRYLHDYDVYRCAKVVSAEKRWPKEYPPPPEGTSDYAYAPGLANDDHPREPVAWDREPWHRHGGNVLYLSGAVTHVEAAELDRLSKTLGATTPEAER